MQQAMLEATEVSKRFFRKGRESAAYFDAVCQASLALHAGEVVVLKGRSGSGKSTLLNMMAGLLVPSQGSVALSGQDLYALDDAALSRLRNERIGVIPQGQTALQSLSVIQNVMLPTSLYGRDIVESRALELLEEFGIAQLADSFPAELSGGELRRVAVARALIGAPDVVLADEPTGDLDDANTEIVLAHLRAAAQNGAAVLLVTHESGAERFADRLMTMEAGHLENAG